MSSSLDSTVRETTVDGVRVAYLTAGRGEPLMLLHGWPEDHRAWSHQLAPLAAVRRVIAPDLPGWGASDRDVRLSHDYDSEVDRLARLLDALGLDRVDLACHDYGGFLGLGFLHRYPHRVRRFALLNSRAHGTFTWPYRLLFGAFTTLASHRATRRLLTVGAMYPLHRRGLRGYVRNGSFSPGQLDDYLSMLRTPEGRRWYAHFWAGYRVRVRPELAAGLAAVDCPTTVIWGRRDPAIPLRTARELASRIPGAHLVLLDADHFVMEQRPAEVTEALLAWLDRPVENTAAAN
ncbi:alpha/beta fold hydrolase [Nocardia farcinica]|uniref:alpha/beta fold hydrolase n=1 Tax=Nocardia farcinica TaxID=37329 RepID=UPI001893C2DB|nr:alpha/beta hydrolase [Nocardia farcinica]MBF6068155.1 alpha/beta hydrolase [Nocardia farcinica]